MTVEIALWLIGVGTVPVLLLLLRIWSLCSKLLDMHETPDQYGFGTIGVSKVITENTTAFNRMADTLDDMDIVLRWLAKSIKDGEPPPRIRPPRT